jgi:sugar lactone lactonase YvrE
MPEAIGSFALRKPNGFIVALRSGIWLARADGTLDRRILGAPYDPAHHRFNDGRCDAAGRFFVGYMNEKRDAPSAALMCIDAAGNMTEVYRGVTISNGLAWSPDGRTMYHSDTPAHIVRAFDYDVATGTIANERVFKQWQGETDRPDGAAVDSEGNYWSAFYRGGKVVKISPGGDTLSEYSVPAMCPTMCAFGGPDLRTLYVTSASGGREATELERLPSIRRHLCDDRRRSGLARAVLRRLDDADGAMLLDPAAYLRLEIEGSLGATSTGASFATSTGDILEVAAHAGGAFRLRLGPNTRPDYGLLVGRARACTTSQPGPRLWSFANGDATLELAGTPLRLRLLWKGVPVFTSVTDEHVRGWTRLPTFGRAPRGGLWTAAFALQSAKPLRPGLKNSDRSTSAGSSFIRRSRTRWASTPASPTRTRQFAWSPGIGSGAWGTFVQRRAW